MKYCVYFVQELFDNVILVNCVFVLGMDGYFEVGVFFCKGIVLKFFGGVYDDLFRVVMYYLRVCDFVFG